MSRSPFLIQQNFLSPLQCEAMVKANLVTEPNRNREGDPVKLERTNIFFDQEITARFRQLIPALEERYNCQYMGLEQPVFQHYPENPKAPAEQHGCENSRYVRKKWVMYKNVDLVGFIWLKDYNEVQPLDKSYEVYGGKLEFPAYNFSLVPQRGTLVMFPAGPNFITAISHLFIGDLYQVKLNVSIKERNGAQWFYQPKHFPGTWEQWLSEFM